MIRQSLLLSLCLLLSNISYGQDYLNRYEYMSLEKIKQKWGQTLFVAKKFKVASENEKAKMTYSLINSKNYIGKPITNVFTDLGRSTGYFFSESVPAYIIGDTNEKPDELWQIVFLLDKDSKTIADVRVQKKCCYKR